MAIIGGIKRTQDAIEVIERLQFVDALRADNLYWKPERLANADGLAQPVHFVFQIGQSKGTAAMPGHRLAGLFLQCPGIQADIVVNAFAKPKARCGMCNLTGGMPGRAGGQFCFLQQNHIAPAFMSEMVGQTTAHNAAADDHHPGR